MAFKATNKARFKKTHASSSAGSKIVQAREVMEKKQQQMRSPFNSVEEIKLCF